MSNQFMAPLLVLIALADGVAEEPEKPVDFAHDVVPILRQHCVECHGGLESKGGFSLNTRELLLDAGAAVPGKPDGSVLLRRVRSADTDLQMPPKGRPRVAPRQIALLRRWIEEGLDWEAGFRFAPTSYEPPLRPRRPELPEGDADHPIDRLLDAYRRERGLPAPDPLDDRGFLRRVSLDLIGLPPTPQQLDQFLADPRADRRARWIDRLLAEDRPYAEHWMTFWNDLLRNAYSGTGYIDGGRRQITQWLYASLMENKPYDQFVRELVAPSGASEGFIRGIKWRGNVNASQTREVQFAQNISQVFLGINMKCASCHDSFIDRWKLSEAYGLAAIYAVEPLPVYRCDQPTGEVATPAWIFPELGQLDPGAAQPERLRQLARLMTHPENGRVTRTIVNRLWRQLMGRGIVHPVDAMHTEPWSHDLLDFLAVSLVDQDYDLKQVMRLIVTSRAYQSRAVVDRTGAGGGTYQFRGPILKRLTAEQFLDTVWAVTGAWPAPDAKAFKVDGRQQGGQLAAVLEVHGEQAWQDRPVRAVWTPLDALQASLGRPNREQVVTTRPAELTTLEAIQLSNGEPLAEILRRGAARLIEEYPEPAARVDRLYRHGLSRPPARDERTLARELLAQGDAQQATEDLLWMLFMLPEFQFVR